MRINKHLLKTTPLYEIKKTSDIGKIIQVNKTDKGLLFTFEIMQGESLGKWTSVLKNEIKKVKG